MTYNYPGSIAEYNMNFSSSVDVVVNEKNELFNAISIYMPLSLAAENIIDFDPAWVTVEKPAVITCNLDNYSKYMKGDLLSQWIDVFTQDNGFEVTLHVIVFADDSSTDTMWEYGETSISFKPITEAFNELYYISFIKTLFDKSYDGKSTGTVTVPGTKAAAQITFTNTDSSSQTILEGVYAFNDGVKDWEIVVNQDVSVAAGSTTILVANTLTEGADAALNINDSVTIANIPAEFTAEVTSFAQGTDPVIQPVQSRFFDFALALANMCKQDIKLSYFVNMIKINYVDGKPDPNDICHIRVATRAEEQQNMTSIATGDRSKYYWGALLLTGCTVNTWTLVHSEPVNIFPLILAAWFAGGRNSSGQFVANKLSMLRLKGARIKPCGFPSWLNTEVNQNDRDGIELFKSKNVGFLRTISDDTPQESCVDSARSIDGVPVSAQMISKWVDYTCAQQCAKFVSDEGTVTVPTLTNEAAYSRIQNIVHSNLLRFTENGRIGGIELKFPPFAVAKIGPRELRAARAWKAWYVDDLEKITISGGIVV